MSGTTTSINAEAAADTRPEKSIVDTGYETWLETAILSAFVIGLFTWIYGNNPQQFHWMPAWLALMPVVIAVRYGLSQGLFSAFLCALGLSSLWFLGKTGETDFPASLVLLVFTGAGTTGELVSMWRRRVYELETRFRTQQERYAQFVRDYHMLEISHAKLEQDGSRGNASLRSALFTLRKSFATEASQPVYSTQDARGILKVMKDYSQLQIAGLHWLDYRGEVAATPTAVVGLPPPFDPHNRLVQQAIQSGHAATLSAQRILDGGGLVAVIPLVDVTGYVWGIVAIYDLPYAAVKSKALEGLALLGGHIGDLLMQHSHQKNVRLPMDNSLRQAIERSLIDLRRGNVPTTLISAAIRPPLSVPQVNAKLCTLARGVDWKWVCETADGSALLILLLPITEQQGAEALARRIRHSLTLDDAAPLDNSLNIKVRTLKPTDHAEALTNALCAHTDSSVVDDFTSKRLCSY